jgi:hypothetical protein
MAAAKPGAFMLSACTDEHTAPAITIKFSVVLVGVKLMRQAFTDMVDTKEQTRRQT